MKVVGVVGGVKAGCKGRKQMGMLKVECGRSEKQGQWHRPMRSTFFGRHPIVWPFWPTKDKFVGQNNRFHAFNTHAQINSLLTLG